MSTNYYNDQASVTDGALSTEPVPAEYTSQLPSSTNTGSSTSTVPVVTSTPARDRIDNINTTLSSTTPTPSASSTQTQQPSALDEYTKEMGDVSSAISTAYTNFTNLTKQIQNGTIPLSPNEKLLLASLQGSFDRQVALQDQANKAYQGGVRVQGIRSGLTEFSPQLAAQELNTAVTQGLQKVQDIETQANLKMAETRQNIADNKYKAAKDSYDEFLSLAKDKQATISDIYEKTAAHEKDLRDYNLEVQKFNLLREKTGLEMEKLRKEIAAESGSNGGALMIAAQEYASKGTMPTWVTKEDAQTVALLAATVKLPPGRLISTATGHPPAGMSASQMSAVTGLNLANKQIQQIKTLFDQTKQGWRGPFPASKALIMYNSLKQSILGNLLLAKSGQAVSEEEYARWAKLFPSARWNLREAVGETKIDQIVSEMRDELDNQLSINGLSFTDGSEMSSLSDGDLLNGALGNTDLTGSSFFNNLDSLIGNQ